MQIGVVQPQGGVDDVPVVAEVLGLR
jgi:hypothetical protein